MAAARRPRINAAVARARRARFLTNVRTQAAFVGATVDLQVDPTVTFGRHVRVRLQPGSHNTLHIGESTTIDDDVLLLLKDGTIRIGPWCDLRRGVVLNVSGELILEGDNVVSWSTVAQCANRITIREQAAIGDQVTLVDSSHFHDVDGKTVHTNVVLGEIEVGRNTLLATKSTLTRNARVGANCIVGANSVVTGTVPDWQLVSGVPATIVRALTPR